MNAPEMLAAITGAPTESWAQILRAHGDNARIVLDAPDHALLKGKGIGSAAVAKLRAARELLRLCLTQDLMRGDALSSPNETRDYLTYQIGRRTYEVFVCVFLDNRHRVIAAEELFRGTIDGASVYPREIARRALDLNAAALIVAHNHPSGVSEPSRADRSLTRRLQDALALIDVRLLDHFVVGDDIVSFAEKGYL